MKLHLLAALTTLAICALPVLASADTESLEAIQARYDARFPMYYDSAHHQIYWYESLKGDCDQNGVVNISDLTRLSKYLNQAVTDQSKAVAAADCDGNGEVNISDLSAMGAHLEQRLTGYNTYWEQDFAPGYPFHSDAVDEDVVSWKALPDFEFDAVGDPTVDHLRFNVDAGAAEFWWFWAQEELAGPVGRLSKMKMASDTQNAAINTYDPNWGLSYDAGSSTLSFYHTLRGDYDQNSEVNLSDSNILAQHFGETGPWSIPDIQWSADANRDNQIDFADFFLFSLFLHQGLIDPIGGFNLYYLPAGGDPGPYAPDSGILATHLSIPLDGILTEDRRAFSVQLVGEQDNPDTVLWIRPVSTDGELGARSEVLTIP